MSKFKHTPGPWKALRYDHYYQVSNTYRGVNPTMKVLVHLRGIGKDLSLTQQSEANAKLIAAAPDMLEALQDCLTTLEWLDDCIETISDHETYFNSTRNSMQLAEEAIKKATES